MKVHISKIRVRGNLFPLASLTLMEDDIRWLELEHIENVLRSKEVAAFRIDHRCEDCVKYLGCLFRSTPHPDCFA